jgi:mRNA interferase MazF
MVVRRYVPDRGDVVWLNFSPQAGREQAGRRPAICLSLRTFNAASGLGLFIPVTSKRKQYPFEVPVTIAGIEGAALVDHVRSLDWKARKIKFISKAQLSDVSRMLLLLARLTNPTSHAEHGTISIRVAR